MPPKICHLLSHSPPVPTQPGCGDTNLSLLDLFFPSKDGVFLESEHLSRARVCACMCTCTYISVCMCECLDGEREEQKRKMAAALYSKL